MPESHHDHLIDTRSGKIIEFNDPEIEALQEKIAARLGYRLVDHRLELFGVPLDDKADGRKNPGKKDVERDRKSTRLNSVTNAHIVCRLLLAKKNKRERPMNP